MLNNQYSQSSSKPYGKLDKQCSFENHDTGEQPPLFEISAKASPAISKGLPKLKELLLAEGIQADSFDELYTAAVNIIKFVACKERRAINTNQEEK